MVACHTVSRACFKIVVLTRYVSLCTWVFQTRRA